MMIGRIFKVFFLSSASNFFKNELTSESFQLDKEQNISKSKYLEMNTFEVENSETKDEDLWNGVKSVGFNGDLALDMVIHFEMKRFCSIDKKNQYFLLRCVHSIYHFILIQWIFMFNQRISLK